MDTILSEKDKNMHRISNTLPDRVVAQPVLQCRKVDLDGAAPEFYPRVAYTNWGGSPVNIEQQEPVIDPNLQHVSDQISVNWVEPDGPAPQFHPRFLYTKWGFLQINIEQQVSHTDFTKQHGSDQNTKKLGVLDAIAPVFYPRFAYTNYNGSPINIKLQVPPKDPNLQQGSDQNSKNLVDLAGADYTPESCAGCAQPPIAPKPQGYWNNNDFPPNVLGESYNNMARILRDLNQLLASDSEELSYSTDRPTPLQSSPTPPQSEEKQTLQKHHGESSVALKEDGDSSEHPQPPASVTHKGNLCFFLKDDTLIYVSIEGAIRLHNFKFNIVMALCETGKVSAVIHPSGRVYQHNSRVELVAHNKVGNRYGKMGHRGVIFAADGTKFTYAVDATGTRKTKNLFSDLTKDFSLNVFSPKFKKVPPHSMGKVRRFADSVKHWTAKSGVENWSVRNIHISQSKSGYVRINRDGSSYFLRTKPDSGSAFISTPYYRATASMGKKSVMVVLQGEKQFISDGSTFIARNAGHEAVLNKKNKLCVF